MPGRDANLYEQVVRITDAYLGPAAERFISRQVQNHLHKEPVDLTNKDLLKLIDWVRVAFSFVTEDTAIVHEYTLRLEALAISTPKHRSVEHHHAPESI